jgi:hypothetical protein
MEDVHKMSIPGMFLQALFTVPAHPSQCIITLRTTVFKSTVCTNNEDHKINKIDGYRSIDETETQEEMLASLLLFPRIMYRN